MGGGTCSRRCFYFLQMFFKFHQDILEGRRIKALTDSKGDRKGGDYFLLTLKTGFEIELLVK